ncbi:S41 family peptidase [Flavobacterium sp. AG291]|uniref:S41 family peptidase n=1 Tax=Flavobacterium sp. AG291 TaxID=2184000 RepID=UPI000E0A84F2|nr:S41 family peptidase [Flavobacterium sp. AG291]RDI12070.1 peptidase S41-like protein [Flavobacterium sp. AG291]
MKTLLLYSIFFLAAYDVFSQGHFKAAALRQDIDSLVYYIESAHPNPYYRYSRVKFYRDVEKVKRNISEDMDYTAFYLVAQRLIAKLQDGHIDLEMPLHTFQESKVYTFPLKVVLSMNKPYIRSQEDMDLGHNRFMNHDIEILSINGITGKKIVNDVVDLVTGETAAFRASYGSEYFGFYFDVLYPRKGFFEISYNDKGRKGTVKLLPGDSLKLGKLQVSTEKAEKATSPYAMTYTATGTAIMKLDDFLDLETFKVFADASFSELKRNGTANLVIDLRGNLGGDSDVGDYLLQYLLNIPFRQYDRVLEKNSELLKNRLRMHRKDKTLSEEDSLLLSKPNGSIDTIKTQDQVPLHLSSRFSGKVYVLVNSSTFSSAADFAQAFSYYKRGKIIGEETGGLILSFGDIVPAVLPQTRLPLVVSSKLYFNIGANENDWHGVLPDILCTSDQTLEKALTLIGIDDKG